MFVIVLLLICQLPECPTIMVATPYHSEVIDSPLDAFEYMVVVRGCALKERGARLMRAQRVCIGSPPDVLSAISVLPSTCKCVTRTARRAIPYISGMPQKLEASGSKRRLITRHAPAVKVLICP